MLATFVSASAHEHREVGKYEFVVGFQNEPAYVNQPNGVWVSIHEVAPTEAAAGAEEGRADRGVGEDPEGNGAAGAATMPVTLRAAFGEPGVYLGDFIPTTEGTTSSSSPVRSPE
ncbi:MAG: hypothetical protein WKH64_04215 [Chloroflexia bacterium]